MKAAQYNKYGGPEVLEINENAPKPTVSKDQVLVEVFAASLNPFDWKLRAGYMKDMIPLQFPVTIGGDFSGTVVSVREPKSEGDPSPAMRDQNDKGYRVSLIRHSLLVQNYLCLFGNNFHSRLDINP
jgi:NADPH:quinone reductase-like Zn-dependent oxidoreductase